ncbi:MAG: MBL fold metallo-hydrolase [Desulfobacteraceae bacterium]|jgi:glyoxylase-like metal-dependent hydrolase (beta-lactamase superfamily II)
MLQDMVEILEKGDDNGNHMQIRLRLASGLEIFGLPTENFYGGEWDLGPTWNYLVLTESPFLVDTGRRGLGGKLISMMESVGLQAEALDSILISHGHEDHDGGLFEVVQGTKAKVRAHVTYDRLIRNYPEHAPADRRKQFPASCWRCFMPESYTTENCLDYQRERSELEIEAIGDTNPELHHATHIYHLPGHSPDSLAILLEDEAIIVGDTILPEITPIPSREDFFRDVGKVLQPEYTTAQSIYGLTAYIKSLKKLRRIGEKRPDLLALPAHRLFYDGQWNELNLVTRVDELVEHHILRCAHILDILRQRPKSANEIAVEHFEEHLLEGFGMLLAENEIMSHCELLSASGDVVLTEDNTYMATGSTNFESMIQSVGPDDPLASRQS